MSGNLSWNQIALEHVAKPVELEPVEQEARFTLAYCRAFGFLLYDVRQVDTLQFACPGHAPDQGAGRAVEPQLSFKLFASQRRTFPYTLPSKR